MHEARPTAGQRVLERTGNVKAAQKRLGHASIQTTGDTYTVWDVDQLAATLLDVLAGGASRIIPHRASSVPHNHACLRRVNGGGGNRTRVRGRTG